MDGLAAWPAFALLGAGHGINPGMGWLFAVALAMQERSGARVWRAMGPLALGHLLAVAAALALAAAAGSLVPGRWWGPGVGLLLIGYGALRLRRPAHPRGGGMRVGAGRLTLWSALMATAHGAGLMLVPFASRPPAGAAIGAAHAHAGLAPGAEGPLGAALAGALVHTASYLAVAALIALVVYHRAGVLFLRRAWVNLDLIWAVALIVTGGIALVRR